jgi:hypothetical protein
MRANGWVLEGMMARHSKRVRQDVLSHPSCKPSLVANLLKEIRD